METIIFDRTDRITNDSRQDTWCSPLNAALQVQRLLGLSPPQLSVLSRELDVTDEDPIFVVQVNPAWVTIYGQEAADAVLDFIGEFEMIGNERRDAVAGRFVYHFNNTSDIGRCKEATADAFPHAFAASPRTIAMFGAVDGLQVVPLAFSAVVHKIAVRQDDVESSNFFYT